MQLLAIGEKYDQLEKDVTDEYKKRESEHTYHLDSYLAKQVTTSGRLLAQLNQLKPSNKVVSLYSMSVMAMTFTFDDAKTTLDIGLIDI